MWKNKIGLSFLVCCQFLTHHLELDIYFGDSILGISNCLLHHTAQHTIWQKEKSAGNNLIWKCLKGTVAPILNGLRPVSLVTENICSIDCIQLYSCKTRAIFVKILAAPFRKKCVSLSIFAKKARKVTFDKNTVTDRPVLAYPGNTFRPLIASEKVLLLKSL